jgi:hypothetical protein
MNEVSQILVFLISVGLSCVSAYRFSLRLRCFQFSLVYAQTVTKSGM